MVQANRRKASKRTERNGTILERTWFAVEASKNEEREITEDTTVEAILTGHHPKGGTPGAKPSHFMLLTA